jgi:excisionase family DNA binding protein
MEAETMDSLTPGTNGDLAPSSPRRRRAGLVLEPNALLRGTDRSPRLLSAQDAAAYTGWPYTTLRDAALRGHLTVVRIPGSRRMWFDRRDLDRHIEAWKERAVR